MEKEERKMFIIAILTFLAYLISDLEQINFFYTKSKIDGIFSVLPIIFIGLYMIITIINYIKNKKFFKFVVCYLIFLFYIIQKIYFLIIQIHTVLKK